MQMQMQMMKTQMAAKTWCFHMGNWPTLGAGSDLFDPLQLRGWIVAMTHKAHRSLTVFGITNVHFCTDMEQIRRTFIVYLDI